MKKIFRMLLCAAAVIGLSTSCSDIPSPYDIFGGGTFTGKSLPYKSANLNSGWETRSITEAEPWSKGSNYVQATGYQAWDGASNKSNKEVESYLVSPAFNTTSESGKVKFSFDYTVKYTNNVRGWENNHKIYITKEYKENEEWNPDVWEEIEWTPVASPYSDWTLYTSGEIQIPEEYTNAEDVRFAFYFYAPATASTTWELMNFLLEEGEATASDTPDVPGDAIDITCAKAVELCAALGDGASSAETYAITGYITDVFANISNGQQSFWMADTQDGGKMVQAYWANLPEGVSSFAKGQKVKVVGQLLKYVKGDNVTTEIKNATVIILESGSGDDVPGDATDITCAKAVELCAALADGATSVETYNVTGYITDVFANISKNQQSFWMADTQDGGKVLQAYWANLPQGVSAFKVGMKVKITGQLLKYVKDGNVTTEIKNANVVILEEGNGGNDNTPTGDVKGAGTEADPYNVAAAIAYIKTLSSSDKPEQLVYTKGIISEVVKMGTSGSIQFKMSDDGQAANSLLVYYCDNLGKKPFKAATDLKAGDKVVVCGKVVNYQGNTPEYASGSYLVSLNGNTKTDDSDEGSGDNTGGDNGGNSSTSDAMTIANLPADITTNAYGSQNVNDESTWLKWTWNGVGFNGAKICKANAIDGTIQFQGNDTDVTKQGFIFNTTAWSKNISKITIVLKVKSDSKYDPSYTLFAGSSAHPTSNAIPTRSAQSTDSAGNKVFTQVFDLSSANAKYFTISNNKAGALYVYSITVE